jgi:hypothetical protein
MVGVFRFRKQEFWGREMSGLIMGTQVWEMTGSRFRVSGFGVGYRGSEVKG